MTQEIQERSSEARQQAVFEQVRGRAVTFAGLDGFTLSGEEIIEITDTFELDTPQEVLDVLNQPGFSVIISPNIVTELKEPIELKGVIRQWTNMIYTAVVQPEIHG